MTEQKSLVENKAVNRVNEQCFFSSRIYQEKKSFSSRHYTIDEIANNSSTGNIFFLAVCVTFLVVMSASLTQTSVVYDEMERATVNAIAKISNVASFK